MFHGFYLQLHPPPVLPTLPPFLTRSCPVHSADILFYTIAAPGFYQTSTLSLLCPCVCVHFPPHHHTVTPFWGHQPQFMGPWLLSPLPCPVPCLCSEAVCCGSTNARVRRKLSMSRSPHVCQSRTEATEKSVWRCLFVFWDVQFGWSWVQCLLRRLGLSRVMIMND